MKRSSPKCVKPLQTSSFPLSYRCPRAVLGAAFWHCHAENDTKKKQWFDLWCECRLSSLHWLTVFVFLYKKEHVFGIQGERTTCPTAALRKTVYLFFFKIVKTLPMSRRLYQLITRGGYLPTSFKFQHTWLWKQHPVTTFGRSSRSSLQTS